MCAACDQIHSRLGLSRIFFAPYTRHQIQQIVTSRLSGLDAFDDDAIEMAARKVASISGDVRRALQVCRYSHPSPMPSTPRTTPHA